jgi:hypothetical protein
MKSFLKFLLALLTLPAAASAVDTGELSTSFVITQFPPRVPSIDVSTSVTVDLSDLTSLTPGKDIAITFTTADDLFWVGGFGADTGNLTLLCHARLTLTAGAYSTFSDETWSFGPVDWTDDLNPQGPTFSDPLGYIGGPVPKAFSLTVPWATDLTSVSLTLTDFFSLSGTNPFITNSSVTLEQATLMATSVPEPSSALLPILLTIGRLCRRKRNAHDV